jgi:hypothetical protein
MLSSVSICRLVKTIRPHFGVWVDKSKAKNPDPSIRYCAFRFYDLKDAYDVAEGMKSLISEGGFDNKVKITSSHHIYRYGGGAYYVRIVATKSN